MLLSIIKSLVQLGPDVQWSMAWNAMQYRWKMARLNRQYARPPVTGSFRTPGQIDTIAARTGGVVLRAERAFVEIVASAPDILRVRLGHAPEFEPPFSYAVVTSPEAVNVRVQENTSEVMIHVGKLVCYVAKDSCRLRFETPEGDVLSEDAGGMAWRGPAVRWSRKLPPGESCYGLGLRPSSLDLRGRRWSLWNADPLPAYERDADPLYTSIPFYVGLRAGIAFGILWDNPARGAVDLGAAQPEQMVFAAEEGELCFYVLAGPTVADVMRQLTTLTGHIPLPPLWALGFHQSRWSYKTADEFRRLAHEFRSRRLPCDVLYFDIDYMDGFRVFTWDRERFPSLAGLVRDLNRQGFKSVAIVDPGIKVDPQYGAYQSGQREDVFLKMPDGSPIVGPVWPGKCCFPDFTKPAVRTWWGAQVHRLLTAVPFAGLWNDMNEPTVITLKRGTTLPDAVQHDWEGDGRTHVGGGHNVYGMQMARATRDGVTQARPDRRPFVLTRAAYAGAHRYTASWTGDNAATWDHLRLSISMVLNSGLSGMPITGPDIGGFAGEPDAELFVRWMQLGSMLPYFRVHTMTGTAPQEPWSYGKRAEAIVRRALERRYRLLPYLYSVVGQCAQDGQPIVRPLFMADQTDDHLRTIDDAFMVGDALLVAPVLEPGATSREVYLPRGVWYEFDTGKLIDGARTVTVPAPLQRMPLYARAGKVLPLWPVQQYVGEQAITELTLRVFAGSAETTLYEDAGEGLAYEQGEYRWSYFACSFLPSGQFAIDWRRAGQYEPPYRQYRVEVVGISGEPEAVLVDGQGAPVWYYEGGMVEFIVAPFSTARIVGKSPPSAREGPTLPRRPGR